MPELTTLTIEYNIDCIALDGLCLLRPDRITAICNTVNIVSSTIYTTNYTKKSIYHHPVHESRSRLCTTRAISHLPCELDVAITTSLPTNPSTPQPSTLTSHTPYNHIHAPRSPLFPSRNRTISKALYTQ